MAKFAGLLLLFLGLGLVAFGLWELLRLLLRLIDHGGLSGHKTGWTAVYAAGALLLGGWLLPRAAKLMRE